MKLIDGMLHWQTIRNQLSDEISIGLVTTMGCLHQGHRSLIQQAKSENDVVVVSIFVNPTQFNERQDYEHYPDTLEADLKLLAELNVDYVLCPDELAIYPNGSIFSLDTTHSMAAIFEGKQRPAHFNGMLTVVMKLLQLVRPTNAYFGEKDYQQYVLVKAMVEDFFLPVTIIACPTLREASGLAKSSRNSRLSATEKQLAERAIHLIQQTTLATLAATKQQLTQLGVTVEYLESYDDRIFSAICIGATRLIDNFLP